MCRRVRGEDASFGCGGVGDTVDFEAGGVEQGDGASLIAQRERSRDRETDGVPGGEGEGGERGLVLGPVGLTSAAIMRT